MLSNRLFRDSPILGIGAVLGTISSYHFLPLWVTIIFVIIVALLLYFYRCPKPQIPYKQSNVMYSPSYGTVKAIYKEGDTITIGIFLSPFDVHQQYYPMDGEITKRVYDNNGKFALAFDMDKSRDNEKKIHFMKTAYGIVKITQIAGFLVRAIVSDEKLGPVKQGDRFGMIKFGSRVDIEIPQASKFRVTVKVGDKMRGGETPLGLY
jgi:phosphatidylserine decarboxylase